MMGHRWKMRTLVRGGLCLGLTCAMMGCSTSRSFSWNPFSKGGADAEVQALVASQQQNARQVTGGKESSLYPPAVMHGEPLPKTEKDLRNPMQLHLSYARLQEQLGHLTEARTSYQKVISREPKSAEAIIGLGRLDALAGRHAEAEQRFRHAVEVSNGSADSLYALGEYMASQERYTEAIVELQKAVRSSPKNLQYRYQLGLTMARGGQYDTALSVLSEVVTEAEANYNVGYIALKEGSNPQLAEQFLARSLELNPELKQSRYWLAQIKSGRGDVIPVSGQASAEGSRVVNAVAAYGPGQSDSGRVTTAGHEAQSGPSTLSPEQLEQWKNQSRPQ
uniref:Tetratricopeptide TPR_1 repeat-containing protein n=1 Tax=Rubinisphaera brasiliensis (strain ATCC 49424 / DSM 5305 / JCM 21570 / IAM 15109 / NBRC 103401 / IFAM 1448) TaxID=756272 RepID=F0STB4_RUBBR|nr:hypothetical protein Plabr_2777 [Rubinisphaera brasiliensis DSM 5305]